MRRKKRCQIDSLYIRSGIKDPEKAVLHLARQLLMSSGQTNPPYNPKIFAKLANVTVEETKMKGCDARLIPVRDGYIAQIREDHPITRRNFSICHEIAHTFFQLKPNSLPQNYRGISFSSESNNGVEEYLCNIAASELLMPEEKIREQASQYPPSLRSAQSLGLVFNASTEAIVRRMCYLDLWPCMYVCLKRRDIDFIDLGYEISAYGVARSAFKSTLLIRAILNCIKTASVKSGGRAAMGFNEHFRPYGFSEGRLVFHGLGTCCRMESYYYCQQDVPSIFAIVFPVSEQ